MTRKEWVTQTFHMYTDLRAVHKYWINTVALAPRIVLVTFCLWVVLKWNVCSCIQQEIYGFPPPPLLLPQAQRGALSPVPFNHLFLLVSVPWLLKPVIQGIYFSSDPTFYSRHISLSADYAYCTIPIRVLPFVWWVSNGQWLSFSLWAAWCS